MANTGKSRVPKEEQLKLINECRTSGMTDTDWCREHGIAVSTFYYWVKQLRKEPMERLQYSQYFILKQKCVSIWTEYRVKFLSVE